MDSFPGLGALPGGGGKVLIPGGAIGVGFGVGTARALATRFGWPMLVQPQVIVASVAFSASVGIVFGLYPARKASQLDPIDALRYE